MKKNKELVITKETSFAIPEKIHDLLIGTLLGDGCMDIRKNGKNWSYRCLQDHKQEDYLFHKYELVQDWCSTGPTLQHYKGARGQTLSRWYFNTKRLGILKPYADHFYSLIPTGKYRKRVPPSMAIEPPKLKIF